jgi:hypothetical protein
MKATTCSLMSSTTLEKYLVDMPFVPVDKHIHTFFPLCSIILKISLTDVFAGGLLGTSLRGTYVMYPYRESHKARALSSQECPKYIRYLITTRIHIRFPPIKIHVE